jgi:hypothetical protein
VPSTMHLSLHPHPDTPSDKVTAIEVEVRLEPADDIMLDFRVEGREALLLPPWLPSVRADRLWETTCFELFLKPEGAAGYFEFNFSPSTEWAAYRFSGHRQGMEPLALDVDPFVDFLPDGGPDLVQIDLDLGFFPNLPGRMGISAIIEEVGGRRSYWALAHGPREPDFHHPDCFALELPAARPA